MQGYVFVDLPKASMFLGFESGVVCVKGKDWIMQNSITPYGCVESAFFAE